MKLAIISEKTRYHFQKPLNYFKKIEVFHLYKRVYTDSVLEGENLIEYKNIFQLYFNLKKIKPDLIQGMEPYYGYSRFKIPVKILPIFFITVLYCKLHHTPYFFHTLENIPPERKYGVFFGKIMQYQAKIYAKNASFIFYVNNGAKKNLLALGIDPNKISFSLWGIWGVDTNEFHPIANPKKRIIFIGSLNEQKGILDLIKAISLVKNTINDIKLLVIGIGPLYLKIEKIITESGLNEAVTLVGEIPSQKIAKYLADSYFLVSPSKELSYSAEQVGVVLIEAAACGVPVISTKTGSIAEFVIDGKTGILVRPDSPKDIAEAIVKLWCNKNLHNTMAKNACENATIKYDAIKNAKKIEQEIIVRYQKIDKKC